MGEFADASQRPACDEVACVKSALGINKKKPHPLKDGAGGGTMSFQ